MNNKKTREDIYNSKIHCLIVLCVCCTVLNCIALQCATQQYSDRHLFFIWFAIKKVKINPSVCCIAPVGNTRETLKNVNECILCACVCLYSLLCVQAGRYTLWAWINLKNLELELKWKTRQKKSLCILHSVTHTLEKNLKCLK